MKSKKLVCLLLAGMMLATAGCGQTPSGSSSGESQTQAGDEAAAGEDNAADSGENAQDREKVEYDIMIAYTAAATTLDNPNDVVTPYIEAKFNVEVGEITQNATSDIPFQEMLAARIAAGNEPDVIIAGNENIAYAVSTGKYGEGLEEHIDKMDNLNKWMEEDMWPRFMIDGKKVQIPCTIVNTTKEEYTSDPWNVPFSTWALWTREDLLKACGYEFKTLAEIEEEYTSKGEVPPEEAYAITPAIDTPQALAEYLQKIKDLGIKVGDRDLIPMSLIDWSQFHVGTMYNFGHWSKDETGEVNGFLGCGGTEDYYRWLNSVYNDGLMDPDFLIQKDDQLQQKVASGLVGVGMMVPDIDSAEESLLAENPEAVIRYIPWPKTEGYTGSFDIYESGFYRVTVANDFEHKDRLCEMWDWMLSDEGLDILTWGPEGTGVWEYDENGVKKFTDQETEQACLSSVMNKKGADYYGLYDWSGQYFPFMSTIGICSPSLYSYNPASYTRSYDAKLNAKLINKGYASASGYNFDGTASYGDGSPEVAEVSNYFWADWAGTDSAEVITAPKDQFDSVYATAIEKFYKKSNYDVAKEKMEEWFQENVAE